MIALSTLKAYWRRHPGRTDAKAAALAWYRHAKLADWSSPAVLRKDMATASVLPDGRVVFNIGGNKYRLVAWINYPYRVLYIRFFGTHAEYDRIDVRTI